jgi:hypothetical protein
MKREPDVGGSERPTVMNIPKGVEGDPMSDHKFSFRSVNPSTHQSRIKIFLIAVSCRIAFAATATLLKKQKPMDLFGSAW